MNRIEKSGTGILALILSTALSAAPTPETCRAHGVLIPDGTEPANSIIVREVYADIQTVSARCQSPFKPKRGCAINLFPGWRNLPSEWVLWAVDEFAMVHERCAALYNLPRHEHVVSKHEY